MWSRTIFSALMWLLNYIVRCGLKNIMAVFIKHDEPPVFRRILILVTDFNSLICSCWDKYRHLPPRNTVGVPFPQSRSLNVIPSPWSVAQRQDWRTCRYSNAISSGYLSYHFERAAHNIPGCRRSNVSTCTRQEAFDVTIVTVRLFTREDR